MAAAETILEWQPRQHDLSRAEDDLEWWHGVRESSLGASGAGFEPSCTQWDDAAIWRLFEGVYEPQRIRNVKRYQHVAPIVAALSPHHRRLAHAIYAAKRYPLPLCIAWQCDRDAPGVVTLVGAALRTKAIREAFSKAHGDRPPDTLSQVCDWADAAIRPRVEKGQQVQQRPPKWAARALTEAKDMRLELLTAYAQTHRYMVRAEYWS